VRRPSGARANGVRHVQLEQHLYARWLLATRRKTADTGRVGEAIRDSGQADLRAP
jgi:hypothetical protein